MSGTEKAWGKIESAQKEMFSPRKEIPVWQWARDNVDFSRAPNYDTPIHGPYDPEYMPFWKQVSECLTDPDVREIAILKATRAGGSENILLNGIRYTVAERPQPTLYVTSDQLSAERFMDKRIKRGLRCSAVTAKKLKVSQQTQHDIAFAEMDFRVTWPRAKQAFKQDGWALVLCDELSTWPEYSADMARRRCDSYPFPHIVFLSSPDPAQRRASEDDPIFIEYNRGDQRKWHCKDPVTGTPFVFSMGDVDSPSGLKWDTKAKNDAGEWDLDKVAATAYYITPDGTRIENAQRREVVASGEWVPTKPDAPAGVRSYHVTTFMIPFGAGDFGAIAVAFLKAKMAGKIALRTFIYEYLAEPWLDEAPEMIHDDEIYKITKDYDRGQSFTVAKDLLEIYKGKRSVRYLTIDVQKKCLWWLVTEFVEGGDCGIVEYGAAVTWGQIEEIKHDHSAYRVYIDNSYKGRRSEVYEEAFSKGLIPCYGRTHIDLPFVQRRVDPFEGKQRGGVYKIPELTWNPDVFKPHAQDLLNGRSQYNCHLFRHPPRELIRQLVSEEYRDGAWSVRRGYVDNHLWDCFVLACLAAKIDNIH
jgi:hypothetical protein